MGNNRSLYVCLFGCLVFGLLAAEILGCSGKMSDGGMEGSPGEVRTAAGDNAPNSSARSSKPSPAPPTSNTLPPLRPDGGAATSTQVEWRRFPYLEMKKHKRERVEYGDAEHDNYLPGDNLRSYDLRGVDLSVMGLELSNLCGTDLRGANLTGARFKMAVYDTETRFPEGFDPAAHEMIFLGPGEDLRQARLSLRNLQMANLPNANMAGAHMAQTDLQGANLEGANLRGAYLFQAWLGNANLKGADLRDAYLRHTDLKGAKLDGADLRGAFYGPLTQLPPDLDRDGRGMIGLVANAMVRNKKLAGQDLSSVIWSGADLTGADLTGADLKRVDLKQATLSDTQLKGANLERANLLGADLSSADLTDATLTDAIYDDRTRFPKDFKPKKRGLRWIGPGAKLRGVNLDRRDLSGANLFKADLSGANLSGCILNGTNLKGANLKGAALNGVHMSKALIDGAKFGTNDCNGYSEFPEGFDESLLGKDCGPVPDFDL